MTFTERRKLQIRMAEIAEQGAAADERSQAILNRIETGKSENLLMDLLLLDQLEVEEEKLEQQFSEVEALTGHRWKDCRHLYKNAKAEAGVANQF